MSGSWLGDNRITAHLFMICSNIKLTWPTESTDIQRRFFLKNSKEIGGTSKPLTSLSPIDPHACRTDIPWNKREPAHDDRIQPARLTRRSRHLPRLPALEERHPDRVRRRTTPCRGRAGWRAARGQGGPFRQAVRGAGGTDARSRLGRCRYRAQEGLRDRRGQTFQIRATRQNSPAPKTDDAGNQGLPAMVRTRT